MKAKILYLVICTLGLSAQAGTTVCAGKSLYYSSVRADLGTKPPTGYPLGSETVVFNAKILVDKKIIVGIQTPSPKYSIDLIDAEVLTSDGNMKKGSSISKKTALLSKINPHTGALENEVSREEVVCQQTWMMAF